MTDNIKPLLLTLFFQTVFLLSFSQTGNIYYLRSKLENKNVSDSSKIILLKKLVKIDPIDSNKVNYFHQLSRYSSKQNNFNSALKYIDTALTYTESIDKTKELNLKNEKATIFRRMGKTERAIDLFLLISKEYLELNWLGEAANLNLKIGITLKQIGDLKNAIHYIEESYTLAKQIKDSNVLANSSMVLGNCYKKLENFTYAEKYYNESLKICLQTKNKKLLAGNYNNIGSLYRMQEQINKAEEYYLKAVKINKELNNKKWLSYNYNNLGVIYTTKKDYQNSLKYYQLSLDIKEVLKDERAKFATYVSIAELYSKMGNHKKAYEYSLISYQLRDSLYEVDRLEETMLLATEFQTKQKEAEILKLNIKNELNEEKLKSSEDRIKMLFIGIVMLFLLIFIIWKSLQTRKKNNAILKVKNEQIHIKNKEITDSINYAKRFQTSILPTEKEMNLFFKSQSVLYQPKDIVSGDFYKFYKQDKNRAHLAIADCTGHGVPGAMVSLIASSFITKAIKEEKIESPAEILNFINLEMPKSFESDEILINDGMDVSLVRIDKKNKTLTFSGANNNCWILNKTETILKRIPHKAKYRFFEEKEHSILELKGNRMGIGLTSSKSHFTETSIALEEDDRIILYTDGYVDQFGGEKNKKFKSIQLRKIIIENANKSPKDVKNILKQHMDDWMKTSEQIDDICIFIGDI